MLNVVLLSRIQFALTIMFHYLFPPLTIGMGVLLVYLEFMFLKTGNVIYESAARFWTEVFAVTFAVGVATGIVMEFQFGTNWAVYSRFVGDVFGSALASEGIFAFFLESGFLAILVFGWDRVSPVFHLIATCFVALGSMFSAVWILVANSWQQTPAGHHIVPVLRGGKPWVINGEPVMRAEVVDFWAVVFNPSTVERLIHTLIGAFLMGAFFVMSISAYYLLRRRHEDFARRSFTGALLFASVFSLAQLLSGHSNAKMVAEQQPAKLAAFEGHFRTEPGELHLFGVPDVKERVVRYSIAVPGALSFLATGNSKTPLTGLDRFREKDWPSIPICFGSYHLMVSIGVFFIFVTLLGSYLRWKGSLFQKRWLLWVFVVSVVPAAIANQAGWVAAEAGRQPWTVYPPIEHTTNGELALDSEGFMKWRASEGLRTDAAISENVRAGQVMSSILMFGLVYVLLGALWLYVLHQKIRKGPPMSKKRAEAKAPWLELAAERVEHSESLTESKITDRTEGGG